MTRKVSKAALLATILLCSSCSGSTAPPYATASGVNGASSTEWLSYGHDYFNQRFSPLNQIDVHSVKHLAPAYVFQTGVVGAFESNPLVAGGVMYLTTALDGVIAINASNGELLWKRNPLSGRFRQCCGVVNRGVALSKDFVIFGQLDDRVVALDRNTGVQKWSVLVADNSQGYSVTMAPLVYRDSIIVGVGGGDLGIRGSLMALSVRDGRQLWRWYATDANHWFGPSTRLRTDNGYLDGEAAERVRQQFASGWKRGGGGVWTSPAIDASRDTIYLTTGNPWPDLDGTQRPGDNLYTDCIVALNGSTGKMRWYFQEVPHDTMDLDAASPPMLFQTVDERGKRVDAVGEIGKTGVFYILNRDTGKIIRQSMDLSSVDSHGRKGSWAGGASWSPMSYDPALGYAISIITRHLGRESSGHRTGIEEMEHEWKQIYSSVTAVNVATGSIVWQDEFDGGLVGGTVSTAGGLTFVGEGNGYLDALDTRTGERVWRFQTGAGVNAPPIAFRIADRDYIAVASGGNEQLGTPDGDALFAFALPR